MLTDKGRTLILIDSANSNPEEGEQDTRQAALGRQTDNILAMQAGNDCERIVYEPTENVW